MIAHLMKITAHAGKPDELLEFMRLDADVVAADEPSTLRCDVFAAKDEVDTIYLYEAFTDDAAFETHKSDAPFKRFVEHIVPNVIAHSELMLFNAPAVASNQR